MKAIFSWLLLLFGETIIITAFILFRGNTPNDIFILNIVVSSLIYMLFFCTFRAPWIDLKDETQQQVGALGINWFSTWLYAVFAIAAMLLANLQLQLGFAIQLIIHCTLLFILLWGLLFGQHSADKVREVYEEQKANRSGIIEMTKAVGRLKDRISETAELPDDNFIQRINTLEENLLFISPSKNSEAHELEDSFVETVDAIRFSLNGDLFNKEQIENNLKKCEYLYQKRKQVY